MEQLSTSVRALGVVLAVGSLVAGGLLLMSALVALRQPSHRLVTTGAFAITRNPVYVGLALAYAGVTVALGFVWAMAALPLAIVAVDHFLVAPEERELTGRFGDDYHHYVASTPRWFVARWRAR